MHYDLNLLTAALSGRVEYFDTIDSTSLYLIRCIKSKMDPPRLVLAGEQSCGQGRVGKSFYSPKQCGFYGTFCFSTEEIDIEHITPRVALAVKDALYRQFGVTLGIKWVNDLYFHEKKVCGILCQHVDDYLLIGIGINLLPSDNVPQDLVGKMDFLFEQIDMDAPTKLALAIYESLRVTSHMEQQALFQAYRAAIFHFDRMVGITQDGKELVGICRDLFFDFSLGIEIDGRLFSFSSGILRLL